MRSIINVVEELMDMNSALNEIDDEKLFDEMVYEINNKIEEMWREYSVSEVSKELEKYEIERWDFVDYIWKVKEYMVEA